MGQAISAGVPEAVLEKYKEALAGNDTANIEKY
jgi:hypothetical protein